ncbi:MAG: Ig-like domain-containing protein, partial [Sulfuricurvum sp.]|nr:Ig-like domain-containing protein [Sulfuricurvum sp.]
GSYTYAPNENYNGSDSFSYSVSDGNGGTNTYSVLVSVTAVNDIPVAQAAVNAVDEDATITGNVAATDVDAGETATLTYALVNTAPTGLTFNTDGSYSFDASSYDSLTVGESLVLTIPYTATDVSNATSALADLVITITGSNDQPVVSDISANSEGVTGVVSYANETDYGISDYNTTLSAINITDSGTIQDLNVQINLTHSWDGDLNISLVAPNGTVIGLSSYNGGSGNNYSNTLFDDEAVTSITSGAAPFSGIFRPEGLLSGLDGLEMQGTWVLRISDDAGADWGTLLSWSVTIDSNGITTVYESNGLETIFTGTLTGVTDLDATDTHTYQQIGTASVVTSSTAVVIGLAVTVDPDGGYTVNGNFDALAEGEIATVTFQYVANDGNGFDGSDGINESSISEPKTVTLTVTGTND